MKQNKKKVQSELARTLSFYTLGDKLMLVLVGLIMVIFFLALVYPLVYALISSFTKGLLPLNLIPKKITLAGYQACFNYSLLWSGFKNSVIYTVLGTAIALVVTICCAYPLANNLRLRGLMLGICMFTMYFDGGLIPTFLWVKNLGLYNTVWAIVLPASLSIYNMIVMRTYFATTIPAEMKEAAELEGASELVYLVKIVLPLSGAVIAVIALYYASSLWNSYFNAMIYFQDLEKLPLANVLRSLLITAQNAGVNATMDSTTAALLEERQDVMKYCVIVISTIPMMCIYPFIQKYFVKGVMIGAVKG